MQSVHYLNTNELDSKFIDSLKVLFFGKSIEITIREVVDETEYLLRSETNKTKLLQSVDNINKKLDLTAFSHEDLNKLISE